jgi:DNA-binding CsgD family transcriptional regulator
MLDGRGLAVDQMPTMPDRTPTYVLKVVPAPPGRRRNDPTLTARDIEMIALISNGATNKELARAFDLSVDSVRSALTEIYSRLGAKSRAHAVSIAHRAGALDIASEPDPSGRH